MFKLVSSKFSLGSFLREVARKVIHVTACGVALLLISRNLIFLEIAFLPVISIAFYVSEKIDFLGRNISLGPERKWGGIMLGVGLSLVMLLPLEYEIKKFCILILMIADVMAALVGKLIPIVRVEVLGAFKSIGGSTAFGVGILIALSLAFGAENMNWWNVAITVFVLEMLEFFNWKSVDNVTLPIAGILLSLGFWV